MKFIQDSEDEDDCDVVDYDNDALDGHASIDAKLNESACTRRGIDSHESPKRDIAAALWDHFQPGKSTVVSTSPRYGLTPTEGEASCQMPPTMSPQNSSITVSFQKPASARQLLMGEDHVLQATLMEQNNRSQSQGSAKRSLGPHGSLHDQSQHHVPFCLFPEPSSTVPFATATQQRLLDEVTAPAFLGIEAEEEDTKEDAAATSISWSEYLKSSAMASQALAASDKHNNPQPCPGTSPSESSLSHERHLSSKTHGSDPDMEESRLSRDSTCSLATLEDAVIKTEETLSDGHQHNRNTKLGLKTSRISNTRETPLSGNLEFPTELYVPPPTRSRSSKHTSANMLDFSIPPEKAIKRAKRGRDGTTRDAVVSSHTAQKIAHLREMGFTPKTAARALHKHNGALSQALDWLINVDGHNEDTVASPKKAAAATKHEMTFPEDVTQAKVFGETIAACPNQTPCPPSPIVRINAVQRMQHDSVCNHAEETDPQSTAHDQSIEAQDNTTRLKHNRSSMDQPESSSLEATGKQAALPLQQGEKRPRGRPKKEKIAVNNKHMDSTENVSSTQELKGSLRQTHLALDEMQDAAYVTGDLNEVSHNHQTSSLVKPIQGMRPSEHLEKPARTLEETPPKPPEAMKRGIQLQNRYGAHRVGLSKRARIAPLLRVVRK